MVGYFTKRGLCARLHEDFEKVYFNVLSKVLENALITLWSEAEKLLFYFRGHYKLHKFPQPR